MQYYETRGFGIFFNSNRECNTTPNRIRKLLALAPEFQKEVKEIFEDWDVDYENAEVDDFAEIEQDFRLGIPYLLARVINERYDTEFMSAQKGEDCIPCLLMCQQMPWTMSDFEKTLTEEKLTNIILEYCQILYDDVNAEDIGEVSVYDFC